MQERVKISPRVRTTIEREVERTMHPFGLTKVDVSPGEDQDGDPIILIDAAYKISARAIDAGVLNSLLSKVRDKLWGLGEERFPHIRHHFPDGQVVLGYGRISRNRATPRKSKAKKSSAG